MLRLRYRDTDSEGETTVEAETGGSARQRIPMSEARFKTVCKLIAGGMVALCTVLVVAVGGTSGAVLAGIVDLMLIMTLVIE